MITPPAFDLTLVAPELIVFGTALVVLMVDLWLAAERRGVLIAVSLLGLAWAAWMAAVAPDGVSFAGMYVRDALARAGQLLALGVTAAGVLVAPEYLRRGGLDRGEYYVLVLVAGAGAMLMAASRDLLMLFLSLEVLSIPLYILAATARGNPRSQEAGMKYFLLGAFASAFFLYGVALLYGVTGTTRLPDLATAVARLGSSAPAAAGLGLLVIGLGFKAAMVPFHTWAPDVYEGAPFPAAAFMSVVAKVGAFVALLRLFPLTLGALADQWRLLLGVLSAVTMIVGNLAALTQTGYKRLLAYSSIAHTGYMMVGIAIGTPAAVAAVITYLAVYAAMTTGAFAVAIALERGGGEADRIEDYSGLAGRAPLLALATAVFMVSLAGLPPTGGFVAKLGVFAAAVEGGGPGGLALALIGVLTSVISVYYYLRVAYVMYAGEAAGMVRIHASPLVNAVVLLTALVVVQIGILPAAVTAFAQQVGGLLR
ncbi:MAG: NADH-quinone oxidoreductase subunit N [Armatimonadetes bacterium]|nr:NADH-quinone oxidoreductase subunit N [Armatimonadota bacterium]